MSPIHPSVRGAGGRAFVFYRFRLAADNQPVHLDTACPTIAAIATLRAFDKASQIYVLTPQLEPWGDFPALLDFHVVQQPLMIPVPRPAWMTPLQYHLCARVFDLWHFAHLVPEQYLTFSDSDVFFRADPTPSAPVVGLQGDARGAGYWRCDKHDPAVGAFLDAWRGLVLGALLCPDITVRQRITGYHMAMIHDESAYISMLRNGLAPGWSAMGPLEHYFPNTREEAIDEGAINLHCHGGIWPSAERLQVVRRVRCFHEAVRGGLPVVPATLLLGEEQPDLDFFQVLQLAPGPFAPCKVDDAD